MKIVETYSHLNGLEYLLVHKKKLWQEVKNVISAVDTEACRTKISKEVRMRGELKFSPVEMNKKIFHVITGETMERKQGFVLGYMR